MLDTSFRRAPSQHGESLSGKTEAPHLGPDGATPAAGCPSEAHSVQSPFQDIRPFASTELVFSAPAVPPAKANERGIRVIAKRRRGSLRTRQSTIAPPASETSPRSVLGQQPASELPAGPGALFSVPRGQEPASEQSAGPDPSCRGQPKPQESGSALDLEPRGLGAPFGIFAVSICSEQWK